MKKLIVKMEFELVVPDDVEISEFKPEMGDLLIVQNRYLEPTLAWMELDEMTEDGLWSSNSVDDDMFDFMESCLRMSSTSMEIVETDSEES